MKPETQMVVGTVLMIGVIIWLFLSPLNIFMVLGLILATLFLSIGMFGLMLKGVFS